MSQDRNERDPQGVPTPPVPPHARAVDDSEPFIPPGYMLGLAALGFLVALVVLFTQPSFGVVGFGGLALGVLALIAWAALSPRQAGRALTGRTARYGGTSLLVTLIVIGAMTALYLLARSANLRADLTQGNDFSLSDQSRQAITGLGADPTLPHIKLLAFYGSAQSGQRDRDAALLDEYQSASNGKIEYQFIDPDRSPQVLSQYQARAGQIAVVSVADDGTPDAANAELVTGADQQGLTNAILSAAAQGDFVAYFLNVTGGIADQMTIVKSALSDTYDWTIVDTTLTELTAPTGVNRLNDPAHDGEVVVIPGGSTALSNQELAILEDYLANGGNVIVFAGTNLNTDGTSLATSANLNDYLAASFGLRFTPEVVADPSQAFQSALIPVATDLNPGAFISSTNIRQGSGLIFETPNLITIEASSPANVIVTPLASSTDQAYTIADLSRLLGEDVNAANATDSDPRGPFVLAASAENSETGARVVLFSSTSVGADTTAAIQGAANLNVAFNSLIWSTNFDNFVQQITIVQDQRPQDAPIFADEQAIRNINFVSLILLPFGVLALGLFVAYSNRERARD